MKYTPIFLLFIFLLFSCSSDSNNVATDTDKPLAPKNIIAESGESEVAVSWDASDKAKGYNIYYSNTANFDKSNSFKLSNVTSPYIVKELTNLKLYYFSVTAFNDAGESEITDYAVSMPIAPATGEWIGRTEEVNNSYIDVKMTLQQKGITVTGKANCIYYINKVKVTEVEYPCTGTIEKTNFRVTFKNETVINDYVAVLLATTQRFNGVLTSAKDVNGSRETVSMKLILEKIK